MMCVLGRYTVGSEHNCLTSDEICNMIKHLYVLLPKDCLGNDSKNDLSDFVANQGADQDNAGEDTAEFNDGTGDAGNMA